MRTAIIAALFFGTLGARAAETGTVKAEWKSFYYDGPNYRRYECASALSVLRDFLSVIDARKVSSRCSWNYGLSADWQALVPVKESGGAKAIGAMLSSGEGPFAGIGEKWRELAEGGRLEARWQSVALQYSMNDLRACNTYMNVLDYLLDELPVRNVSSTVFCSSGSSFIRVQFDYLRPKLGGGRAAADPGSLAPRREI